MKKIEFEINKEEIVAMVDEAAAYTGVKTETGDGSVYDRVATVSEDAGLLSRFLSDAYARASEKLTGFVKSGMYDGNKLRIDLEVSDSIAPGTQDVAARLLKEYLAAFVTARWMRLAMPAKGDEWQTEADALLLKIERQLYSRRKPVRS